MKYFCSPILLAAAMVSWAADTGQLKTEVDPGRAGVFVDGKYLGPAANFKVAQTYNLTPGEHEVRLVEPRYEEIVKKVTIVAGKKTVVKETMKARPLAKPPFGKLRTEYPDHFAAVYVNGQFMGHVDEFSNFAQSLLLNPGSYEVKIVPVNGGAPLTKTVAIEANKTTIVK
ncbi:MAG TPA: PEGA domain-containing protein [Bryobacteraceae bacterium]|nr:PEGA domain-containing protein [Bryobacteraceae bacterium]